IARPISPSPASRISSENSPRSCARTWSRATMLFVSAIATMSLRASRSSATGKTVCRLENSRGTSFSAIESTTIWVGSTLCGRSSSKGLFAQLLNAQPRVSGVEARRALVGQSKGALVKLKRQFSLVQLIEADGEIEGVVGILRIDRVGFEIRRLRFGPARLLRILVAEGEMQKRRLRLGCDEALQAAFRSHGVELAAQGDEARHCVAVARIDFEQLEVTRLGRAELAVAHVDGREA